ncbi:MAG: SPOR domain-containing protein [Comamonas sp.]|nr:SPOR domain-containing protein [Comamonas sp.]
MSVNSPRSNAHNDAAPSGMQASGGIMPSLYRLRIGHVNTAYYQQHFDRFESQGKASPTWNHGAAFFTLAWLLFRQMFRLAMFYAGFLLTFLLLWWAMHGRVPLPVEVSVVVLAALLLFLLPGCMGNALYYHHVRKHTLDALTTARTVALAQVQLQSAPVTRERLNLAIAAQAVASLTIAGLLASQTDWSNLRFASSAPERPASGPPDLVIPSPSSVTPMQPPTLTPEMPLPSPPAQTPSALTPAVSSVAAVAEKEQLSIVALAQVIPAQAAAKPVTATATATATASAPEPKATVAAPKPAKTAVQPPAKPVAPVPVAGGLVPGKFYLNAGVYAQTTNAERSATALKAAKLPVLRQTVSSNKGEMTRLRIGPYDTRAQADKAAAQAKLLNFEPSVFQQPQK